MIAGICAGAMGWHYRHPGHDRLGSVLPGGGLSHPAGSRNSRRRQGKLTGTMLCLQYDGLQV